MAKLCPTCETELKKDGRTECFKCRCARKFAKNGIATSQSRIDVAIPHLANKQTVWRKMFNLRK